MSVGNSLSGLASLYAASSAPGSASTVTPQSVADGVPADDTITDQKTLTTSLAQEQLAYLTQMQTAFQAGLLASGIVDGDAAPLIFGTGSGSMPSIVGQSSATSTDGLVITPGLSSLGASVLSGETTLQDVVDAGTKNAQASHTPDAGYVAPPPPPVDISA